MGLSSTSDQVEAFRRDGFTVIRGAFEPQAMDTLEAAARDLAAAFDAGTAPAGPYPVIESILDQPQTALVDKLSKIFRVHRVCPAFASFTQRAEILGWMTALIGADVDCFLSQFIFKLPGALGQPWHQDAFYFPFEGPPQVGLWVAVTDAEPDNGPLWVLPGSHTEPVHRAARDPREHSNPAYFEITDHVFDDAVPVLMAAGDALVFHSHLMHKSTDNGSDRLRAAMVYHYAHANTVDHSVERFGRAAPNMDWTPLLRNGLLAC